MTTHMSVTIKCCGTEVDMDLKVTYAGCRATLEHPADPPDFVVESATDLDEENGGDLTQESIEELVEAQFDLICEAIEEEFADLAERAYEAQWE